MVISVSTLTDLHPTVCVDVHGIRTLQHFKTLALTCTCAYMYMLITSHRFKSEDVEASNGLLGSLRPSLADLEGHTAVPLKWRRDNLIKLKQWAVMIRIAPAAPSLKKMASCVKFNSEQNALIYKSHKPTFYSYWNINASLKLMAAAACQEGRDGNMCPTVTHPL